MGINAIMLVATLFIGLLPDSVLSCGQGALLLQLPLLEVVGSGSQAESQFKSSAFCTLSSTKYRI